MEVFAPYLGSLLDYAAYQNLKSADLRRLLSNPHLDLSNPHEMVAATEYLAVFNEIIQATNNQYCGLDFGCYLNLSALGLVLEISLNTSSIEQGVFILQNFLDKKFPLVSAKIVKDPRHFTIELESSVEDAEMKRQLLDMVHSIIFRELKLMLPDTILPILRLPFKDAEVYYDSLKEDVAYYPHHQILLPLEIVSTEINSKRVKEIELLLPKFMSLLNQSGAEAIDFSQQVRNMILNMCSPEIPSFKQVQRQFPYSNRTIQRKLTREGQSFRAIANSLKEELSNYLVHEKHLKTKDIAYILGYSESSAYLHAVNSWRKNASH